MHRIKKQDELKDIWDEPIKITEEGQERPITMWEGLRSFFNALHSFKAQEKSWKWTDGEYAAEIAQAVRAGADGHFELNKESYDWLRENLKSHGHLVFGPSVVEVLKIFTAEPEKKAEEQSAKPK